MNAAGKILHCFSGLDAIGLHLPPGIGVIDPYHEDAAIREIMHVFYQKFYSDHGQRLLILGINPGRFGAGVTGVPFTDSKRLVNECGIPYNGKITHEPSSVFIYEMINAYGGPEAFYRRFYISSVFPLALVKTGKKGVPVNYNYYDDRKLFEAVKPFIIAHIRQQLSLGITRKVCFCLGTGKNAAVLQQLNSEYQFFEHIISLEHPRFIMQYKLREKEAYVGKYLSAFAEAERIIKPTI
jgi:hypothetical protein